MLTTRSVAPREKPGEPDGAIDALVVDNGRGFVVFERNHLPGHLGLHALNERSLPARRWTKVVSKPGIGTSVELWMPEA